MKNIKLLLVLSAVLLIASFSVNSTLAYFSSHSDAEGGKTVVLSHSTEIVEKIDNLNKFITVKNTGKSTIFVRVAVFYSTSENVTITLEDGWTDGKDGYYYYAYPLDPGQTTSTGINAAVSFKDKDKDHDFQVVAVCENTQYVYYGGNEPVNAPTYKGWHLMEKEGQ